MKHLRSCWVWWLLGCTTPDSGALYRQAAGLPPEQAAPVCVEIPEEGLQGECLSFAASAAIKADAPELAASICAQARSALWRDECAFLVADRREGLRGEAVADCETTGRFRDDCLSHALERDLATLPREARRPGGERLLHENLVDMATHYGTGDAETDGGLLLAHIIARRVGPGPLRMQACGEAPAALCEIGFLIALSVPGRWMNREAACQPPRTPESVAAAGVRPWQPEAEVPASAALERLCAVVASGGDPSHLGALIEATPALPMGTHFMLPPPWRPGINTVPWDDGI